MSLPIYRTKVLRAWIGGGSLDPDPETYYLDLGETVQLVDDVLSFEGRQISLFPVQLLQIECINAVAPSSL
jgi:hypothetical protein